MLTLLNLVTNKKCKSRSEAAIHGYRKILTIKYIVRFLREIDVSRANFYLKIYGIPKDFPLNGWFYGRLFVLPI
jgi:hypothetical protein